MAVVEVSEVWQQRGGNYAGIIDEDSTRHFRVRTNSTADTDETIMRSGMIPAYLDAHPNNASKTVRSISIRNRSESPLIWDVTVEYSNKPLDQKDQETETNPLNRPLKCTIEIEWLESFTIYDRDGNVMRTSAEEPYEPIRDDILVIKFACEKNVETIPDWFLEKPRVNSVAVELRGLTMPAGTAKLVQKSVGEVETVTVDEVEITFTTIKYEIQYRSGGWKHRQADAGYQALDDDGLSYEIVVSDKNGQQVRPTKPQFLDGEGHLLDTPIDPEEIETNDFDMLDEFDFSGVPLT